MIASSLCDHIIPFEFDANLFTMQDPAIQDQIALTSEQHFTYQKSMKRAAMAVFEGVLGNLWLS